MTDDEQTVVVDRFGAVYHDPSNMACTTDMDRKSLSDAKDSDAKPCTYCHQLNAQNERNPSGVPDTNSGMGLVE